MTTTREEQRDVVDDPTYSLEVVHGKAGDCVCLNDRRICGPKPWGGGRITSTWSVRRSDILAAIPDLEAENDRLRASQAGGVPAGWKLVPVEPTPEMLANADVGGWPGFDALRAFWGAMLPASPPPPATDGDALREALVAEVTRIAADCEGVADNHRKGWRNEPPTHAAMWDRLARELRNALASSPPPVPEIVAPQVVSDATADTGSASAAHLEQILPSPDLGQAAELVKPQCDNPSPAALASVPTPVSDGDSVLRKAVALVITHHVNQNRQKRRPESDSFTLKTLREALAATPVSATDAVEAERRKFEKARTDIQHLLAIIDFTAEATGEGPDDADAQMVADIRADYGSAAIRARGTEGAVVKDSLTTAADEVAEPQ